MKIYDRSRFYSNLVLALAVVAIMALALLVPGLDEKVQIAVLSGGIGLLTVLFRPRPAAAPRRGPSAGTAP
jgi:hypothetical protein